jgi:4-amino-4-deoxy-L-arabinose transferase-like glycosyltransferase
LAVIVALPGNGDQRPLETHEVYVARTAEEMLRNGELLRPTFNGELRLEKPPLNYWLAIGAHFLLSGGSSDHVTELEARLPSVLAGIGLVLVAYFLGRATFEDRRAGAVAGILLATSAGFSAYSHNARPEMVYTLGCGIEVLGFRLVQRHLGERRRATWAAVLAWAGFTLALLSKGPLLPTFILIGVVLGLLLERPRSPLLRVLRPGIAALVVVPVTTAVFAGLVRAEPTAPTFWWNQMFHHGGSASLAWYLPLEGYYLYATLPLLLPWIAPLPGAVRMAWKPARPFVVSLGLAVVVSLLCLSFSPTRRAYYMLPALTLVFVLMAPIVVRWFDAARASEKARRRLQIGVLVHFALLAVAAFFGLFGVKHEQEMRAAVIPIGVALGALLVACTLWLLRPRSVRALAGAFVAFATIVSLGLAVASWSGLGWQEERFNKAQFARDVAHTVRSDQPIVSIGPSVEALVYYGDRFVKRFPKSQLADILAREPRTYLLVRRGDLAGLTVPVGEVVLSGGLDDDDGLLIAPRAQ